MARQLIAPPGYRLPSIRWVAITAALVLCISVLFTTGFTAGLQTEGSGRRVEFEVSDPPQAIGGFVVGYFETGKTDPAFEYTIPRDRAEVVRPGVMRFALIQGPLPAGQTFVVRIRTRNRGRVSAWSAPSEPFTVTQLESETAPAYSRPAPSQQAASPPRAARSALTQLERRPALRARMQEHFPSLDLAETAPKFRSVGDLVTAIHLAANLKVSLEDVRRALEASSGNFETAIAALKPGADARLEFRKARRQTRAVLAPREEKKDRH